MTIGRGGACREGAIEDARGDETRGRFVLMASDMIWVGCFGEDGRVDTGVARERVGVGIWRGGPGVGERRGGRRSEGAFGSKRACPYKRMYVASRRSLQC
jgi:hypothetical protein